MNSFHKCVFGNVIGAILLIADCILYDLSILSLPNTIVIFGVLCGILILVCSIGMLITYNDNEYERLKREARGYRNELVLAKEEIDNLKKQLNDKA